jgi:hypothetical protein
MTDHAATAHFMKNFGVFRLHSGTKTGGEDDGGDHDVSKATLIVSSDGMSATGMESRKAIKLLHALWRCLGLPQAHA